MIKLETRSAAEELAALRRSVRDLAALATLPAIWVTSDLKGGLQNLAEVLAAGLRGRFVFIRVRQSAGEVVDAAAQSSLRPQGGFVNDVRRHLTRHFDLDGDDFPPTIPAPDGGGELGVSCSHVAMEGRIRGVVLACAPEENGLRDHERLLLHTGAAQVAILLQRHAIESAREAEARKLQEQTRLLEGLNQVADTVNRAAALPAIYDAALRAIRRFDGADRAAILLYDAGGVMRFVAWDGLSEAYRNAVEGHSPWQRGDPNARPMWIDDIAQADLEPTLRAVIEREGINALAFIPLTSENRLLGKFMVYFNRVHPFTADELRPIETVASQVAFAIERRKSAAELESLVTERTASLQKVIEQMEEFSYSVSHDLRSPVRAMRGYAEAILADYGSRLDDHGRELLDRIQRNGSRMDRLIQDLLTYTRLARREIRMDVVSLDRLVREVVQHYPEMSPEVATIEILGTLPDVMAHEPSLMQAVSNLLSNAVKFVPRGTRPCVKVGSDVTGGRGRLWVEDNGIGIPAEYQQRLFGLFERVHGDQKFEGTGIGLAIVRKSVERMHGATGVVSDGKSGSRFWIELPLAENR